MNLTWKATLRRAAVAGAAILATTLALAQSEPRGPGGPPAWRGAEGPVGPGRQMAPGLEPKQRAAIQRAVREAFAESRAPLARLRELRQEMHDAIWADPPDKEQVRQTAKEMAKIEVKLAMIRARAVAELRPVLNPRQIERLRNAGPEFWGQLRDRLRAGMGNSQAQPARPWLERQAPGGPGAGGALPPGGQMRRGAGGPPPWAQPPAPQDRPRSVAPAPPVPPAPATADGQ